LKVHIAVINCCEIRPIQEISRNFKKGKPGLSSLMAQTSSTQRERKGIDVCARVESNPRRKGRLLLEGGERKIQAGGGGGGAQLALSVLKARVPTNRDTVCH